MNALSLNSLWSYIQSLSLTASNKKWLADHLYEAVKEEAKADKKGKRLQITQDDLILSADMLEPVKDITPLPADFDFDKARQK
ncbi:MAG: hypothetical protein E7105_11325 [Prevotella sp.]|jgi:hypothetical protein|nr:hypothetical protein [Prevotella sp.]